MKPETNTELFNQIVFFERLQTARKLTMRDNLHVRFRIAKINYNFPNSDLCGG